jgi:hypothetical protein
VLDVCLTTLGILDKNRTMVSLAQSSLTKAFDISSTTIMAGCSIDINSYIFFANVISILVQARMSNNFFFIVFKFN